MTVGWLLARLRPQGRSLNRDPEQGRLGSGTRVYARSRWHSGPLRPSVAPPSSIGSAGSWTSWPTGTGSRVAIEGEPGIGKTRLLADLRGARREPRASGPQRGRRRIRARSAAGRVGGRPRLLSRRRGTPGAWRSGTPSCSTRSPACSRRCRTTAAAAARCRRALSGPPGRPHVARADRRRQPVVLLLDDLHWADRASIDLIAALVRRPPRRAGAARALVPSRDGA